MSSNEQYLNEKLNIIAKRIDTDDDRYQNEIKGFKQQLLEISKSHRDMLSNEQDNRELLTYQFRQFHHLIEKCFDEVFVLSRDIRNTQSMLIKEVNESNRHVMQMILEISQRVDENLSNKGYLYHQMKESQDTNYKKFNENAAHQLYANMLESIKYSGASFTQAQELSMNSKLEIIEAKIQETKAQAQNNQDTIKTQLDHVRQTTLELKAEVSVLELKLGKIYEQMTKKFNQKQELEMELTEALKALQETTKTSLQSMKESISDMERKTFKAVMEATNELRQEVRQRR